MTRPRLAGILVATLAVGLIASVLQAKQGVVTMKTGRTFEGEVDEHDSKSIVVTIHGVQTTLERENVDKVEYHDSLLDQFNDRLGKLDSRDAAGRVELARWAFDQHQYDLSRQALEQAIAIDPKNREAQDLLDTVRGQIRLERTSATRPSTTTVGAAAQEMSKASPQTERHLLSASEINRIRQDELRATDTGVRFNFTNEVKKRFVTLANMEYGTFNAMRPLDQALAILDYSSPSGVHLSDDVKVLSDPAALREYRQALQPLILSGCATSGCHGGAGGGDFILYLPNENAEAVSYTNFYILQNYARKIAGTPAGVFGATERRMVDRGQGNLSLLVQYGLPQEIAEFDHPDVKGYRPMFRTLQDQDLRRFVTWMDDSLRPVQPDYGISYAPPVGKGSPATREATTKPTTRPASAPAKK